MLTADQLKRIDKHLRSENWLLNDDLITELTDHYANAITDKLAQNISFDAAIQDVHCSFGGRKGLLRLEETYQQAQAKTNARVYREAFKQAFGWPGLGYTLLVWLGVYYLLANFPVAHLVALLSTADPLVWVGILSAGIGLYGYTFVTLYQQCKAGKSSFSTWSSPLSVLVQSTAFLCYCFVFLPVQRGIEHYPAGAALAVTLIFVHERAVLHMIAFVRRQRLA